MGFPPALEPGPTFPGLQAAVELLSAELARGGVGAELAAEALTGAAPAVRLDDRQMRAAWQAAADPVKARLCPALAGGAQGRLALARLLSHPDASGEVQAAAAWALAGARDPGVRRALEWASASSHPAVAANARAALAVPAGARDRSAPLRVRLVDELEGPQAGRWLVARLSVGPVWFRTGGLGQARLSHPGSASAPVESADEDLRLR
jgi:hypothetical protein